MCTQCDSIATCKDLETPDRYRLCREYIAELIAEGTCRMVMQTCPLDAVTDARGFWVDDIITHEIECIQCGKRFVLFADTYHGRAGFTPKDMRFQ